MDMNELGQTVIRITPDMIGVEPPSTEPAVWPAVDITGRKTTGSRNVTKHIIAVGKFVIVPVEFTNYVLVADVPKPAIMVAPIKRADG